MTPNLCNNPHIFLPLKGVRGMNYLHLTLHFVISLILTLRSLRLCVKKSNAEGVLKSQSGHFCTNALCLKNRRKHTSFSRKATNLGQLFPKLVAFQNIYVFVPNWLPYFPKLVAFGSQIGCPIFPNWLPFALNLL